MIDDLIECERKFGGLHTGVKRNKVSPLDPRSPATLAHGGMTGGDRMLHHQYATIYSACLPDVSEEITLVELGILRGVGLAIWCELFPNARVIGLDVDLSHYKENEQNLRKLGAFRNHSPEVYEYDELAPTNAMRLRSILGGDSIDVCIDDALHYDEAILKAARDLMPFMRDGGVYFIEDNAKVHEQIRRIYPTNKVVSAGKMTVIQC